MKIYNYHPETKVYLGEGKADKSPLERDVFLIPAYATDIQPPQISENKLAIFDNGDWILLDIPLVNNIPEVLTEEELKHKRRIEIQLQIDEIDKNTIFDIDCIIDVLISKELLTIDDVPTFTERRIKKTILRAELQTIT